MIWEAHYEVQPYADASCSDDYMASREPCASDLKRTVRILCGLNVRFAKDVRTVDKTHVNLRLQPKLT